jgi:predicted dinucleotide-binding enzyme
MKICIIGSGHIGAGLARAWSGRGHALVFGARNPDDSELVSLCRELGASAASVGAAPKDAEVVVLAVPYGAVEAVLGEVGSLAGKVVIDCTNAVERGMTLKYGHTTSSAEEIQKRIPQARVFKSFNAQGAENLARPSIQPDVRRTSFAATTPTAGSS